jgi:cold shock CspA family protein
MKFRVTSPYGALEEFREHAHNGVDLGTPMFTELRSLHDGIIEKVVHLKDNIGNGVIIRFDDGTTGVYGHLSEITVKEGQRVLTGQSIGFSGSSGTSTGAHLHFGLKEKGQFIDPTPQIEELDAMTGEVDPGFWDGVLNNYNELADWAIGKQVELIFAPIWSGIKWSAVWFVEHMTIWMPDIVWFGTLIVAALVMFGVRPHKMIIGSGSFLGAAILWLMNAPN